jgi:hypothetical protein
MTKKKKPKLKSKNKFPKVILQFDPNPTFKEEFLEFVETVLSWNDKDNK